MISRERILELRRMAAFEDVPDTELIAICDLALKTPQWIAWKPDDSLPPNGTYWITRQHPSRWDEHGDVVGYDPPQVRPLRTDNHHWWVNEDVIAYWSEPLPAPYVTENVTAHIQEYGQ